ncbi:MAG: hypothetical protein L0214_07135 [candidate division NC10 bacterium]|nr:hypothetical protein [candidate division NC10 bacterium]
MMPGTRLSRFLFPLLLAMSLGLSGVEAQTAPLSSAVDEAARRVAEAFPKLRGTILDLLPTGQLLLDLPKGTGAYPGLELEIVREGEPFKHPVTGEVLGRLEKVLGLAKLTEAQEKFSLAEVLERAGGESPAKGDAVRVTGARILLGLGKVESGPDLDGAARSASRDLAVALARTERFEVLDDRRLRSTLLKAGLKEDVPLSDPRALEHLRKELRIRALALPRLTPLEGRTLVDVQVLSALTGTPLTLASVEVKGAAVAAGKAAPAPSPPAAPPAQAPQLQTKGDLPPPTWVGPRREGSVGVPLPLNPPGISRQGEIVLGPEFDTVMVGMAVADFLGTGGKQAAVASGQKIWLYAIEGRNFRKLWESEERVGYNILALDAADLNGNGRAELFVTNYSLERRIPSFVLEWEGNEFKEVWKAYDQFFRTVQVKPSGEVELYGQGAGEKSLFYGRVRRVRWDGKNYVPTGSPLDLPPKASLYGFLLADVDGDGSREYVILDQNDYLRVYDLQGRQKYKANDRFGGSETVIQFLPPNTPTKNQDPETISLQGRLFLQEAADGRREIVVYNSVPSAGYLLPRSRYYDRGKIYGLRWNGLSLQQAWETMEFPGHIADYALVDLEGDGARDLVVLVSNASLLTRGKGTLFAYVFPR